MSIFFFKQNAAYEMRISDWSSYVCSSDLEIHLHGNPIHGLDARVINRLGMARSFQITNIFPGLSVFENLRLGIMRRHGLEYNFWKRISGAHKVKQETDELLERVRLTRFRDTLGGEFSDSDQRWLARKGVVVGKEGVSTCKSMRVQ